MKIIPYLLLSSLSLALTWQHIPAQASSLLCDQRSLFTMISFSTEEYHIAICKEFGDAYYYAGQSKRNRNEGIFLPITERNNPYTGANPWILKAHNGNYTYQVAEFNPLADNSSVSISVFKNGKKIYHRITNSYFRSDE